VSGSSDARAQGDVSGTDLSESVRMRAQELEHNPPPPIQRLLARLSRNADTRFLVLVVGAGLLGGGSAIVLRTSMDWLQSLLFGGHGDVLTLGEGASGVRRLLAPTIGCALAGLVLWLTARFGGGGGGVATLMEAVSIRHGVVRGVGVVFRSVASVLAMAGGASVGREGPIIALSSAGASWLGRQGWLDEERLRVLVACGAAAGFAAAYNTPVAGVLFVMEIIIGAFAVEVLGPVALASIVGAILARWSFFGGSPLYEVPVFELRSVLELPAYVVLGLAAAAGGSIFLEVLRLGERVIGRLGPVPLRTALGGLGVGLLAMAGLPEVYGNGYEVTSLVLRGTVLPSWLALIFVAKILATTSTVGSGVPGGVFTPTLLLGATLGGALGHGVHTIFPGAGEAGAYALVGMGAMLSATTHAPLLAVVFVFEVSQDYAILMPLLLACSVSTLAARRLRPFSIYAEELERRGIRWEATPAGRVLEALHVRDVMRAGAETARPDRPAADVVEALMRGGVGAVHMVDEQGRLLGVVDFDRVRAALSRPDLGGASQAQDLARDVQPLDAEGTLVDASERLWRDDAEQLPVVGPDGTLLGVLTRRDLLAAIDTELLRRNVMLAKVRWRDDAGTVTDFFELPRGQRLEQVQVPPGLVGRTLEQAALGRQRGVNVLAVVRHAPDGGSERFAPRAADLLADGDVLVVLGTEEAIDALRAEGGV
jgi:CIC family chloride channel protein